MLFHIHAQPIFMHLTLQAASLAEAIGRTHVNETRQTADMSHQYALRMGVPVSTTLTDQPYEARRPMY